MSYTFINRADVPVVLQRELSECGAAALAMVFAFYGKRVPWQELLTETINEKGLCSAASIVRAAHKHGFDAHGYKRDISLIRGMEMPCILYWNYCTFVVLEGFEGDQVYIIDPAVGTVECSLEDVEKSYTGVCLTVRP